MAMVTRENALETIFSYLSDFTEYPEIYKNRRLNTQLTTDLEFVNFLLNRELFDEKDVVNWIGNRYEVSS